MPVTKNGHTPRLVVGYPMKGLLADREKEILIRGVPMFDEISERVKADLSRFICFVHGVWLAIGGWRTLAYSTKSDTMLRLSHPL